MTENKPEVQKSELDPFDALIAGIKISHTRQKSEGRVPPPTPEIDKYLREKRQRQEKRQSPEK